MIKIVSTRQRGPGLTPGALSIVQKVPISCVTIGMKYYCCAQIRFLTFLGIIVLTAANVPAERQPGFPLWSIRFTNLVADVLVDGLGNSYLVGSPNSGYPMNVVKVAPSGQLAWSVNVDDRFIPSYPRTAVIDPLGNLYVGGATFAPSTNPARPYNYEDFATAKFSPAGQLLWRVTYDPPDETTDYGNGIGRDLEGNLYVVGRSFEPNIPGAYDTVLKYDRDGHLLWVRRFEPATNSSPNNVGTAAVNPLGGVAAVGNRTVASYSANGDLLWSWQGASSDVPAVFDHQSHLYIISSHWNGRSFESALIKFSPTGEVLWTNWYQ